MKCLNNKNVYACPYYSRNHKGKGCMTNGGFPGQDTKATKGTLQGIGTHEKGRAHCGQGHLIWMILDVWCGLPSNKILA